MLLSGPKEGRFTQWIPLSDVNGQGAVSQCGGGTLKAAYESRITSSDPKLESRIENIDDDLHYWLFRTSVEILRC